MKKNFDAPEKKIVMKHKLLECLAQGLKMVNVKDDDFDVMLQYSFWLVADGMPCIRIDEEEIMVKYCGYSLINTKTRKIQSRLKKYV